MSNNILNTFHAKKTLGQNFLVDPSVSEYIGDYLNIQPTDCIAEIGPGKGALTRVLLKYRPQLHLIELDDRLIHYLQTQFDPNAFTLHHANVLKFNFRDIAKDTQKIRVVGNLPYNISTPLLFRLADFSSLFSDLLFMLQKEVVDRIVAEPDTPDYGRLSVMTQFYWETVRLRTVGADAFQPAPKVESALVYLRPRSEPFHVKDWTLFAGLVKDAFNQRRKTIRNSLKHRVDDKILERAEISGQLRAENLSLQDFIRLANTWEVPPDQP